MLNVATLLYKWLVRKNIRDSVGNHLPAKGIRQTCAKPEETPRNNHLCGLHPTGDYSPTSTTNPADVAIVAMSTPNYYSWGEQKRSGRRRTAALQEGAAAGVTGLAPDHYARGSGVVTDGGERRRDRRRRPQA